MPLQPARADVAEQLGRLVYPGLRRPPTGVARLADVERYLRAAARRLERLPNAVAADRDRMSAVHELEAPYAARSTAPAGARCRRRCARCRWMLEELRVSHFAQALGTRGQVSSKRIRRVLDSAAG